MPAVPATNDALSRVVTTLESSLPMYLADSGLQTYPGADEIRAALARLVEEQRGIVGRAGAILDEREAVVPRPAYPMSFTALHDTDLRHLLPRIIMGLRRQADACASIAASAERIDAAAAELGTEAAVSTRRHLEGLERLVARPASATTP